MLTLSIHGMAYVVRRHDAHDVLMDPAMGHHAILNIPTRFLNPMKESQFPRWDPDFISFVPFVTVDGFVRMEQIATWSLSKRVVTIGNGTPGRWEDRLNTIAFDEIQYPTRVTTAKPLPPGCALIRLLDGELSSGHRHRFTLIRRQNGATIEKDWATEIHVNMSTDAIFSNGMIIQLREDSDLEQPPFAAISNAAVEANLEQALLHFQAYYDGIVRDEARQPLPNGERFDLTHSASDVYDCIPPTTGS